MANLGSIGTAGLISGGGSTTTSGGASSISAATVIQTVIANPLRVNPAVIGVAVSADILTVPQNTKLFGV